MSDGSNYLDPDRPEAVRLSVGNARSLGEAALVRIGYGADDACIITRPYHGSVAAVRRRCGSVRRWEKRLPHLMR
jgi:hypothetical protein